MKILYAFLLLLACALPLPASADRCFGAAGDQCGALSGQGFRLAACVANPILPQRSFCNVSAGSWTHDQCCFANRSGNFCAGATTALCGGSGRERSGDAPHHHRGLRTRLGEVARHARGRRG